MAKGNGTGQHTGNNNPAPRVLDDLAAREAALAEREAALEAAMAGMSKRRGFEAIDMAVGQSGKLSVYFGGAYPVTVSAANWLRILDAAPRIKAFIAAHKAALKG